MGIQINEKIYLEDAVSGILGYKVIAIGMDGMGFEQLNFRKPDPGIESIRNSMYTYFEINSSFSSVYSPSGRRLNLPGSKVPETIRIAC